MFFVELVSMKLLSARIIAVRACGLAVPHHGTGSGRTLK